MWRHDASEAAHHYRDAVRSDPGNDDAVRGLARALQTLGDASGALPLLESVRRRDRLRRLVIDSKTNLGTDPRIFFKLGRAAEDADAPALAVAWYRLAIALDPLDAEAQRGLSRLDPVAARK